MTTVTPIPTPTPDQATLESRAYSDYRNFFREIFEVTRRWKIMNPEKLRGVYGKLVYLLQDADPNPNPTPTPTPTPSPNPYPNPNPNPNLLQDANQQELQEELGFSPVKPVRTWLGSGLGLGLGFPWPRPRPWPRPLPRPRP